MLQQSAANAWTPSCDGIGVETDARIERDRAGVVGRRDEVQPRDAALLQRRDERVDEPPAPALPLQLGQQVDVEVRGILLRRTARAPGRRP